MNEPNIVAILIALDQEEREDWGSPTVDGGGVVARLPSPDVETGRRLVAVQPRGP
jgi:hypothetical protein